MARGRGHGNMEDEDMEDINRPTEETCTIGRGSLSHHATHSHPDGRYSLHPTHSYSPHYTTLSRLSYAYLRHDTEPLPHHTSLSHVIRPYPTYAFGQSTSHYTSSSPPGHPYPHQHAMVSPAGTVYTPQHSASPSASHHDTPSPPVHVLPAQHGTIPSSSHHSTPSPPGYVYPHEHGIRPSSSHHITPHHLLQLIPVILLELHHSSVAAGKMSLVFKSGYLKEGWKWEYVPQSKRDIYWLRWKVSNFTLTIETKEVFEHYKRKRTTDEAFKKKSEQMSMNRKSGVGGPGTGISLHSAGSISTRQHGDTLEKKPKCRPTCKEMFRHLYTHGHDGQTFIDQKSTKIDVCAAVTFGIGVAYREGIIITPVIYKFQAKLKAKSSTSDMERGGCGEEDMTIEEFVEAQAHIFKHTMNYIHSTSLKCAVELGIPGIIHNHKKPMTHSELVNALQIPRSRSSHLRRLMRMLVHDGFFVMQKVQDHRENLREDDDEDDEGYVLTRSKKLLLKDHWTFPAGFAGNEFLKPWESFGGWLKGGDGETAFEAAHGKNLWNYGVENVEFCNLFNASMAASSRVMSSVLVTKYEAMFEGVTS
ncbi:hypothetical protein Syun_008597 [Stephania yunnanensis]|uniref:O-methyltransferase dimerisation domain-containing protein n=1 Tax=Stephania yunnanensis TaxID=152371 RepID=A0AAP0KEN0_9MAGN